MALMKQRSLGHSLQRGFGFRQLALGDAVNPSPGARSRPSGSRTPSGQTAGIRFGGLVSKQTLGILLLALLSGCQTTGNSGRAALDQKSAEPLRVCAGENELPYSNRDREGFENAIAEVLGKALNRPVEYVWWQDARFVVRDYLNAGKCDVIIGADPEDPRLATTEPYYRSGYVFVTRKGTEVKDWDDPQLRQAERIAFVPHSPAEVMLRKIGRYEEMFF